MAIGELLSLIPEDNAAKHFTHNAAVSAHICTIVMHGCAPVR